MENQLIISIGREAGSGGHQIATKLSKHYGLSMYDHNLLDEIASEKGFVNADWKKHEEKRKNIFTSRRINGLSSSPEENISMMQFDYLKKMASRGESFVVVGRCSESVLKDFDCMISAFILGDMSFRAKRVMAQYQIDEKSAEKKAKEIDLKRMKYHNRFSARKWGDSRNYDICINSSLLGIDETVELLINYIDRRRRK